uniref:SGNH domain-containing protein n=1 Tax=Elaeophora elaphi TaxID=1147741 RepID=A0A0R3RLA9_9BILA
MIAEIVLIFIIEGIFCNDTRQRLITLLKTDQKFHDQWIHLVELQHRQIHEQNMGSALEEVPDLVRNCAPKLDLKLDHVDYVCPADIQLYAELGQLTRFCNDSILELIKGRIDSCHHASYTSSLPSIVKFLMKFIRNLTIIETSHATKLENQTQYLVEQFMEHRNWRNKWKLIVIMPNIEDGELREPEQSAVEVMKAIKLLYEVIPQRTILIVIRSSTLQLWQDASKAHRACQTLLEPWEVYKDLNPVSIWDQVEKISGLHFQSSLFSVQILPLMEDASLPFLAGSNQIDLSLLGHDCVHFSPRGLSLLHIAIWNAILTRLPDRSQTFNFSLEQPICADPQCPFIRTNKNSALCVWNHRKTDKDSRRSEQLIAIIVLMIAMILFSIALGTICCCRRHHNKVTEIAKNSPNKPPVGADWTSWKYIDEDSISSYKS